MLRKPTMTDVFMLAALSTLVFIGFHFVIVPMTTGTRQAQIDSFIREDANHVCAAFYSTKPDAHEQVANTILLKAPHDGGALFKYVDAGSGRFKLALRDRDAFAREASEQYVQDVEKTLDQSFFSCWNNSKE